MATGSEEIVLEGGPHDGQELTVSGIGWCLCLHAPDDKSANRFSGPIPRPRILHYWRTTEVQPFSGRTVFGHNR